MLYSLIGGGGHYRTAPRHTLAGADWTSVHNVSGPGLSGFGSGGEMMAARRRISFTVVMVPDCEPCVAVRQLVEETARANAKLGIDLHVIDVFDDPGTVVKSRAMVTQRSLSRRRREAKSRRGNRRLVGSLTPPPPSGAATCQQTGRSRT